MRDFVPLGTTKVVTFLGPTTESMIELASGERCHHLRLPEGGIRILLDAQRQAFGLQLGQDLGRSVD